MRIKKNDMVRIVSGDHKGKTGKVVSVQPAQLTVKVEGIGLRTRTIKPSQLKPQGGTKEIHTALPVGKVALITDKDQTTRIGYELKKDGTKVRVARKSGNKEIK